MKFTAIPVVVSLLTGAVSGETTITNNGKTTRTSESNTTVTNTTVIGGESGQSKNVVKGSGQSATETREPGSFTEIRLNISADVTVTAGARSKCTITGDANILPLIVTACTGNALMITAKGSYSSARKITVAIEAPFITRAANDGSGRIDLTNVTKDSVLLEIGGSGDITAKGKVTKLIAIINGSGAMRIAGMQAATATITVNGSGDADVNATTALVANINGSGNISYTGTPSSVQTSSNGAGVISKK